MGRPLKLVSRVVVGLSVAPLWSPALGCMALLFHSSEELSQLRFGIHPGKLDTPLHIGK